MPEPARSEDPKMFIIALNKKKTLTKQPRLVDFQSWQTKKRNSDLSVGCSSCQSLSLLIKLKTLQQRITLV